MAKVVLELHDGTSLTLDGSEGGALADLCDEVLAPVRFSCRSANCGTCLVEVLSGESELEPATPEEQRALGDLHASPTQRLACVAGLRAGVGEVRITARRTD